MNRKTSQFNVDRSGIIIVKIVCTREINRQIVINYNIMSRCGEFINKIYL